MKKLTVMIPAVNRQRALAVTLSGFRFQNYRNFDIVVPDQSGDAACDEEYLAI